MCFILVANTSKLEVFRRKIAASPVAKSFGKGQEFKTNSKPSSMLAWALSSVARKGAVCYYSVSEFMGLLGQFDANAATLKGISSKRLLEKKERNPPYSKRIGAPSSSKVAKQLKIGDIYTYIPLKRIKT